eukprot:scaffold32708_cov59-Phaeocystis_antarctica.AAC.1
MSAGPQARERRHDSRHPPSLLELDQACNRDQRQREALCQGAEVCGAGALWGVPVPSTIHTYYTSISPRPPRYTRIIPPSVLHDGHQGTPRAFPDAPLRSHPWPMDRPVPSAWSRPK